MFYLGSFQLSICRNSLWTLGSYCRYSRSQRYYVSGSDEFFTHRKSPLINTQFSLLAESPWFNSSKCYRNIPLISTESRIFMHALKLTFSASVPCHWLDNMLSYILISTYCAHTGVWQGGWEGWQEIGIFSSSLFVFQMSNWGPRETNASSRDMDLQSLWGTKHRAI